MVKEAKDSGIRVNKVMLPAEAKDTARVVEKVGAITTTTTTTATTTTTTLQTHIKLTHDDAFTLGMVYSLSRVEPLSLSLLNSLLCACIWRACELLVGLLISLLGS
jgi:hypothetical protein